MNPTCRYRDYLFSYGTSHHSKLNTLISRQPLAIVVKFVLSLVFVKYSMSTPNSESGFRQIDRGEDTSTAGTVRYLFRQPGQRLMKNSAMEEMRMWLPSTSAFPRPLFFDHYLDRLYAVCKTLPEPKLKLPKLSQLSIAGYAGFIALAALYVSHSSANTGADTAILANRIAEAALTQAQSPIGPN
jgi:hypothetical protein